MSTYGLDDVQAVYSGPEGDLWKLIMGEQIHIGGLSSSMDLAEKAGIQGAARGIDLCCAMGSGMRFLARFQGVAAMEGVDATDLMVERGREITREEGLSNRVYFTIANACNTGLPDESADFVWGEDAWCYVEDKDSLIAEAVRLVKPGGVIAFTDWMIGAPGLSEEDADRFYAFMKFPYMETIEGYSALLVKNGCEVQTAMDTGRFAPHVDLYISMVGMQLTYDALKILNFNTEMVRAVSKELAFTQVLAREGKIIQGLIVARKT